MAAPYFLFKQFVVAQQHCAMKVTADATLFGAWAPVPAQAQKVLDIGCGTGLLSLMLAQRFPQLSIDAIELEEKAARQAAENVRHSRFHDRIMVQQADARTWQPAYQYDFVICNPPFYSKSLAGRHPEKNMAWHSQSLSLSDLAALLERHLSQAGSAALLLPETEFENLQQAMSAGCLILKEAVRLTGPQEKEKNRIMSIWERKKPGSCSESVSDEYDNLNRNESQAIELLSSFNMFL